MLKLKRRRQEEHKEGEEESFNGNGQTWFRGPLIAKETSGQLYIATSTSLNNKPTKSPSFSDKNKFPTIFTVKSSIADVGIKEEAMLLDNLYGCPHIRQMLGQEFTVDPTNGQLVSNLLLEYCSGGTLACLIRQCSGNGRGRGLPEDRIRDYTRHILLGLARLHEQGFVWGDLKPDNVLLAPNGDGNEGTEYIAKLGDLGLARRVNHRKGENLRNGDVKYMAPETWARNKQEPCSDIWALGCVVDEMLQGHSMWDGMPDSEIEDILFDVARDHRDVAIVRLNLSSEGNDFLNNCLVKKADRLSARMLLDHPFVRERLTEEDNDIGRVLLMAVEKAVEDVNTASSALKSSRKALEAAKQMLEAAKEALEAVEQVAPNETLRQHRPLRFTMSEDFIPLEHEEELEGAITTPTQSYNSHDNEDGHETQSYNSHDNEDGHGSSRSFQDDDEEESLNLGSVHSANSQTFDEGGETAVTADRTEKQT